MTTASLLGLSLSGKSAGRWETIDNNRYGYIRVSSKDQNEDRQLIALREAGVPEKNIYIRQRQAEGIAAAKAKGIRFGRVPKPLPENFHAVYQRWKSGEITGTAAAKECGMPLSTFRYRAAIYEKAKL